MWTSTLDLDPKRVLITQLLRRVWSGASFSSLAPLQVQNLPRQSLPEKNWVRVRNRLAGICGSDLHMLQGDGDFRVAPAALPLHKRSYPGHEVVGEVLEVGEDVQRIRVGDRVVLQYGPNCISARVQTPCRSCAQGNYNLCEYGKLPDPAHIGGGWSEEMLLPEQQLFRLPTEISDEQAVLLEPTAVAVHAVLRRPPQQNERILIIGAGAIGLLTLQVVRALAPQAEVSVQARHSFQIEQATRLGATHIIYPQDSYTGIQRATNAQLHKGLFGNQTLLGGYDVIFDTVGSQKTLHHALRWARAQAMVVLVGVNLHLMHIDLTPVWYREINLIGTIGSSVENWPLATNERRSTFEVAAELIEHDSIHPEHLITHRFPLNNYRTALLTAEGKAQSHAIKVVFDYSLLPPSVVPTVRASAVRKRRPSLPLDESTSIAENEATAESVPPSAQPTEPAIAIPLSPLFLSSQTVAPLPYEDDEFDEMEDTIPSLAIAKHNKQASTPQQQEQDAELEEEIMVLPALSEPSVLSDVSINHAPVHQTASSSDSEIPSETFLEQDVPQSDDTLSEQETEAYPVTSMRQIEEPFETDEAPSSTPHEQNVPLEDNALPEWIMQIDPEITIETHATEQEEHADEPSDADTILPIDAEEPFEASTASPIEVEEPSNETVDILEPSDETTEPSAEIVQDSDETLLLPLVSAEEAIEYSETQTDEVAQATPEPVNQEAEDAQYNSEHSEEQVAESAASPAETSEKLTAQTDAPELLEPVAPIVQEVSYPPDSAIEEKTDADNATRETEKALLHTEEPTITKVQNRSRPRTRKKSNRASVEKR